MAKGMLIWQPDRSLLDSKTHRYMKVRFNQERKHKRRRPVRRPVEQLGKLREPARYVARDFELSESKTDEMVAVAEKMHEVLVATSPRRAMVNS